MKRALLALTTLALLLPANAFAKGEFHPDEEFELHRWGPKLAIGPFDFSLNKAVVYLLFGSLMTIALGIFLMRLRVGVDPTTRQTIGETIYDIAQTQVAEQGLPSKAIALWFPYVAAMMLFIWVIYAATSQISVTLALALMTFTFTHVEGIRFNGPVRYFKSWIPEVPKAILPLIVPLEILGQFMRLISLSVRLYANMLAGHMLILTFIGLIFVFESLAAIPVLIFATAFYLFEVVIVVSIQAFIFAALSAIYIGSAIEPEH
jgi:F-type H+-transporting ATPase subunit a